MGLDHATTILFDLPGVRVRCVDRDAFGDRIVHVETADEFASGCPSCGVVSTSVKEYVPSTPRDLPYGENGISVVWHKRRWRCTEPACARLSFTEAIGEVPAGRRTTGRLRRGVGGSGGDAGRAGGQGAGSLWGGWPAPRVALVAGA